MENPITQALKKLFANHRIIFWYDSKKELRKEFEAIELDNIEKIELENNEFSVKYRILKQEPDQKFLLYKADKEPEPLDNWLLDVQIAHGEFRADQTGLWLSELGLSLEFADIVGDHSEFFRSHKRREAFKQKLKSDDTNRVLKLKMLGVCCHTEPRIEVILEQFLLEFSEDKDDKYKLGDRCSLTDFFWQQMTQIYGYNSASRGIEDFVIELFKSCFFQKIASDEKEYKDKVKLTKESLVFINRWKDSLQLETSFKKLSSKCAKYLNIETELLERDFRDLLETDYFRLIDQKIIRDLVKAITQKSYTHQDIRDWVKQRRQSHWYKDFAALYEAIDYAAQFIFTLDQVNLTMISPEDGIQRYCESWYLIDQLYRKFIFHYSQSAQPTLLGELNDLIESLYSNNYLLKLNDRWQVFVDQIDQWLDIDIPSQKRFFQKWVEPFLEKDKKVCVIISDALRYEIGHELAHLIRQENRLEAELDYALSMIPSYTQLGMAALLPNTHLAIAKDKVFVDGLSSQGLNNRRKILEQAFQTKQKQVAVIKAEKLRNLNRDDSRSLFKNHDVVYVYHNWIDAIGDKLTSEDRAFEAVETTCNELILLIKKLTNANATNLIITADHGFIYQHQAIEESDFSTSEVQGEDIQVKNRRFVLGTGLKQSSGLLKFQAHQLDLSGDIEIQFPKSINRIRVKGSGSRFVHGGTALQEVIIPVLKINKKRQGNLELVEVIVSRKDNTLITSGQLAVTFYQEQPITAKTQGRTLQIGLFTKTGEPISEVQTIIFDSDSPSPREREKTIRFILSKQANSINNEDVYLKLNEKLNETTHYTEYKSITYRIQRSFTTDFDF